MDLFRAFEVTSPGSRRPPGPRRLQWVATLTLAVAALEAGLEELIIAAHGKRTGKTGQASLARGTRKYLIEDPLQAPNAQKVERILFGAFGVELGALAPSSTFTARRKLSSNTTSGKGSPVAGPQDWDELKEYLDALLFIRNATAHGDVVKLSGQPPSAEGLLWLKRQNGTWSVQQPHALTGLRTVVATYNLAAQALDAKIQLFAGGPSPLRAPNEVVDYAN